MEMLIDYHLIFIAISFVMLFITVFLIIDDPTKERLWFAVFFAGINYILCLIISLGFFGIGIVGYTTSGTTPVTLYSEMFPIYALFFLLHIVNAALIFYCYYKWAMLSVFDLEAKDEEPV